MGLHDMVPLLCPVSMQFNWSVSTYVMCPLLPCCCLECEHICTSYRCYCLQEICRSLDLDLTGQTSASYNMRLNYEKCLLEFEKYLAFGRYSSDLAEGTAPPTHHLEAPPSVKPTQGHFVAP